jgi:hypothetical protein
MAAKKKTAAKPKMAAKAKPAAASAAKPKFGSPAWDAKYGVKKFKKGGK